MIPLASAYLDLIVFDIGGTLVHEAAPSTSVSDLVARPIGTAVEDLARLADQVLLAAATDTSVMREADVRALLAPAGLDAHLPVIVTSVDVGAAKPNPASLRAAMEQSGAQDPNRVLFVGNADVDAQAAAVAGCHYATVQPEGPGAAVNTWLAGQVGTATFAAIEAVRAPSELVTAEAGARHEQLAKPQGALGQLEVLGIRLAAMSGVVRPPDPVAGLPGGVRRRSRGARCRRVAVAT